MYVKENTLDLLIGWILYTFLLSMSHCRLESAKLIYNCNLIRIVGERDIVYLGVWLLFSKSKLFYDIHVK